MSLDSTTEVLQAVRTRLLTFTPASGSTLATLLGTHAGAGSDGKLYLYQAPDNVTHPYGVLRVIGRDPDGDDGQFLKKPLLELHFYHRPRAQQAACEALADRAEEAWTHWLSSSDVISARGVESRATITYDDPADRELVCVRMLLKARVAPDFLTRYAET